MCWHFDHVSGRNVRGINLLNALYYGKWNIKAYSKGAVEAIAQLCALTEAQITAINQEADSLANLGVRVLGVAEATLMQGKSLPNSPREIQFNYLGLQGCPIKIFQTISVLAHLVPSPLFFAVL